MLALEPGQASSVTATCAPSGEYATASKPITPSGCGGDPFQDSIRRARRLATSIAYSSDRSGAIATAITVRPSGEKLRSRCPIGASSRTSAPCVLQLARSMNRTVPDASPTASSRPSGLTSKRGDLACWTGGSTQIRAAFCCRSANRSQRVSDRFWSLTPATASNNE